MYDSINTYYSLMILLYICAFQDTVLENLYLRISVCSTVFQNLIILLSYMNYNK